MIAKQNSSWPRETLNAHKGRSFVAQIVFEHSPPDHRKSVILFDHKKPPSANSMMMARTSAATVDNSARRRRYPNKHQAIHSIAGWNVHDRTTEPRKAHQNDTSLQGGFVEAGQLSTKREDPKISAWFDHKYAI
jgi:hypothetical protein